jgi:excisionase family DNA binding protein
MEKLWTTSEVAKFLKITEADVERLVQQGLLTGYKLGGQFLRFRPDQVQGLQGAVRASAEPVAAPALPAQSRGFGDFVYFYDFYLVSAALLAVLVVYLLVSA